MYEYKKRNMPRPYQTNVDRRIPIAFAQTVSWVPFDPRALFYDGINVNYFNNPGRTVFHGVPTDINPRKLEIWSTTTGNNDGYDYTLSDPSIWYMKSCDTGSKLTRRGSIE